jgi:hypothetical protein
VFTGVCSAVDIFLSVKMATDRKRSAFESELLNTKALAERVVII